MPNRGNVPRSVVFLSTVDGKDDDDSNGDNNGNGNCDPVHLIKPGSVDDSMCGFRPRSIMAGNNVYDFLQTSLNSSPNPMVRSNSFHQEFGCQRKNIQVDYIRENLLDEDIIAQKYLKSRRMSKSLPELNQLRVLPKFANALSQYQDIIESEMDDDDEDATSSCIATDTEYHPAWANKQDFLMTIMGFSLGLNTFWRFPYFCYINNGGTVISSIIVASIMLPILSTVNSWSMLYFFKSFHKSPAWFQCNNRWNDVICFTSPNNMTRADQTISHLSNYNISGSFDVLPTGGRTFSPPISSRLNGSSNIPPALQYASQQFFDKGLMNLDVEEVYLGTVNWKLAIILFLVWMITFIHLRKGFVFSSNPTFCLAIIPMAAFGSLFLHAVCLSGAFKGITFFFKPSMEGILQPSVWLYAAGFTLHSLGNITGISLGMAKYHRDRNNFMRDSVIACLINYALVVMVGVTVFSVIGHLSVERKVDMARVLVKEPGLSFVAMSELLATLPLKTLWSCAFFSILFCLGVDNQIAYVATLIECIKDRWRPRLWLRGLEYQMIVLFTCLIFFSISLFFITKKGLILIRSYEHYVTVILTVLLALLEVILVGFFYGAKNLVNAVKLITCKAPGVYFYSSWRFCTPMTLLLIIGYNLYDYQEFHFRGIRDTFITSILGPITILLALLPIPICGLSELKPSEDKIKFSKRLSYAFRPEGDPISDLKQGNTGGKMIRQQIFSDYFNTKDTASYDAEIASSDLMSPITYSRIQGLDRETTI
ncbi:sodium- and chloride-dependent betaine transporter-like isoform X2 [Brevipalpus obovatus]|uniref:sodium- and chloride-dependent betaine transporter-like isoform X2 n=1 Tax=Brevipalpus obovatus TaxID=246614 RepID=UPI003D9F8E94